MSRVLWEPESFLSSCIKNQSFLSSTAKRDETIIFLLPLSFCCAYFLARCCISCFLVTQCTVRIYIRYTNGTVQLIAWSLLVGTNTCSGLVWRFWDWYIWYPWWWLWRRGQKSCSLSASHTHHHHGDPWCRFSVDSTLLSRLSQMKWSRF